MRHILMQPKQRRALMWEPFKATPEWAKTQSMSLPLLLWPHLWMLFSHLDLALTPQLFVGCQKIYYYNVNFFKLFFKVLFWFISLYFYLRIFFPVIFSWLKIHLVQVFFFFKSLFSLIMPFFGILWSTSVNRVLVTSGIFKKAFQIFYLYFCFF